tara:strand:+ start:117 stop:524 length:408 start_codon:yes stop_codon:yes gene_type:complete
VEGEGFEPPEDLNPRWFSRPVHSARLCHPSNDYNFVIFFKEFTVLYKRVFNLNQLFLNCSIIVFLLLIRLRIFVIFAELIFYLITTHLSIPSSSSFSTKRRNKASSTDALSDIPNISRSLTFGFLSNCNFLLYQI